MEVLVIGAGVAGLCCALELAKAGLSVTVVDKGPALGASGCSWFAGGMLAPWCEGENAPALVVALGQESLKWWKSNLLSEDNGGFSQKGSLVVAQEREQAELERFSRRSQEHCLLQGEELAQLEPDLVGRYRKALYYSQEAHIDPRSSLLHLSESLQRLGGTIEFGVDAKEMKHCADYTIDCRGLAARDELPDLRGVKGEMLLVQTDEVEFSRSIRLLHPRIPLYVVPRGKGVYMVGATMVESDDRKGITARAMIELLQGAYALHPAFAEAEVVEIGTEVRPAFSNNVPRIRRRGHTIYVNGLYRHGFLLAPSLACEVREMIANNSYSTKPSMVEVVDEYSM